MVERSPWIDFFSHLLLILGVLAVAFPVYLTFVGSTLSAVEVQNVPMQMYPGNHAFDNYSQMWTKGVGGGAPISHLMWNSLISALIIAVGKITLALISAFAIVYFRFPFKMLCFWIIFMTLMLPVEVRILPTHQVVASLGMIDTRAGLTVPLLASATATFLMRQFYLTLPDELTEAARIDGAGPLRFFKDILLPLSVTNIAALFVIMFIYGWNQYLWPLISTTREDMYTAVIGVRRMISGGDSYTAWNLVLTTAMLVMLPPAVVIIVMQRWFVKGLVDSDK